MKYTTPLNMGLGIRYRAVQTSTTTWIARKRGVFTCKLNNVDRVFRGSYTWIWLFGHCPTLVSSHDVLRGVHMDRASQNFIGCPSYLMPQLCQPCISLHIIHSSQIQKCTVIGLGVPEIHTTRWLASVLIVFPKRLADFMKKLNFVLFLHGQNSIFYIGIQN